MTSPLWGKYCDGGHYCSAPKECCTLGCCYHALPANGVLSLWFLGHWYFWALALAAILALLCVCSLWRRCWRALRFRAACPCCGPECGGLSSSRDDRASEPDSTGSCYAPPHYSRCNSFHRAPPPPYAEVTSKPDLYPLVISYNGDTGIKRGGSASYLMVQYFRNYILRPSGSISATSTIDSLSSSFICNAANEANSVIPPPYSCTGSLEGFTFSANSMPINDNQMVHSASSVSFSDYQQNCSQLQTSTICTVNESTSQHLSSVQNSPTLLNTSNGQNYSTVTPKSKNNPTNCNPVYVHNKTTSFINNLPSETILNTFSPKVERNSEIENRLDTYQQQIKKCHYIRPKRNIISTENSIDSETSQGEDHNFSELLNLSVCAPGNMMNYDIGNTGIGENEREIMTEQQNYSIANSVTVSDISSLANLGTPDSPPRATSPTVEIRELLDKIQQLPQQKSPGTETQQSKNRFFVKNKSKTLYMPLNTNKSNLKLSPSSSKQSGIFSYAGKTTKGWLSRSAPTTPCGNFVPLFPSQRKNHIPKSHNGSKSKMDDASALLTEFEVSDDEHNNGNIRL